MSVLLNDGEFHDSQRPHGDRGSPVSLHETMPQRKRQADDNRRTCLTRLMGNVNQLAKNNPKGYNSIMEKSVPHGKLAVVQALVATGKIRPTFAARQGTLDFKEL